MRTRTTGRAGQQQARAPRSGGLDQAAWSSGDLPALSALRRGNLIFIGHSGGRWQMTMTHGENQATADSGGGIEVVSMPAELDLTTSEGVAAQGCAAIARLARLVLLDLTGLSFCDARGLSAFVRIANQADAAGYGFGLIAPRPPVAKILLDRRSAGQTAQTARRG